MQERPRGTLQWSFDESSSSARRYQGALNRLTGGTPRRENIGVPKTRFSRANVYARPKSVAERAALDYLPDSYGLRYAVVNRVADVRWMRGPLPTIPWRFPFVFNDNRRQKVNVYKRFHDVKEAIVWPGSVYKLHNMHSGWYNFYTREMSFTNSQKHATKNVDCFFYSHKFTNLNKK